MKAQNKREVYSPFLLGMATEVMEAEFSSRELLIIQEHTNQLLHQIEMEKSVNPDRPLSGFELMAMIENQTAERMHAGMLTLTVEPQYKSTPETTIKKINVGKAKAPSWRIMQAPKNEAQLALFPMSCAPGQNIIVFDMNLMPLNLKEFIAGANQSSPAFHHEIFVRRKKETHSCEMILQNESELMVVDVPPILMRPSEASKHYIFVNMLRSFMSDGTPPVIIFVDMKDRTESIDLHDFVKVYFTDQIATLDSE